MVETAALKSGATWSADEPLVELQDLTKRYGQRIAVDKLTLTLRPGEIMGLVGANGGGKTTMLRMLAGILKPDHGRGQVLSFDLAREGAKARQQVGYMAQRFSLYTELSVFENLRFRAEVYGLGHPRAAAEAALDEFAIRSYRDTAVASLSGGWARRLQLAAALIHSPRLILLDEPSAGLDAVSRQEVWHRIATLAAQGAGVIVSTHDLADAERCSRAAFLSRGRVLAAGTPEDITRNAPALAFVLSGTAVNRLAQSVEEAPGVITSYAQGLNLRVVAEPHAEETLYRLAAGHNAHITRVAMRLEDAVLLLTHRSRENAE